MLFLFSGSHSAFDAHLRTVTALGTAKYLGADPTLASLYDTALFGMAWGALSGFYHALALVETEGVKPAAFADVARGHLPFVGRLMVDHSEQIQRSIYTNADGAHA